MKAELINYSVEELGIAPSTRLEEKDTNGNVMCVSYDSMSDITMRVRVIGREDREQFIDAMMKLQNGGAKITGLGITSRRDGTNRKYVFE